MNFIVSLFVIVFLANAEPVITQYETSGSIEECRLDMLAIRESMIVRGVENFKVICTVEAAQEV